MEKKILPWQGLREVFRASVSVWWVKKYGVVSSGVCAVRQMFDKNHRRIIHATKGVTNRTLNP